MVVTSAVNVQLTRRIACLFVIQCVLAVVGVSQWRKVETGSLAWFHAVEFVDDLHGWAGGSNGTLIKTLDGGLSWKRVRTQYVDSIRDIHFQSSTTGWLLCDRDRFQELRVNRSYLLKTVDGGNNWTLIEFPEAPDRFVRMIFSPNGRGFAVGEGGYVASIPGTGNVETRLVLPEKYLILSGSSFDIGKLLLVGGGGSIFWTDDGGRNWNSARFIGSKPLAKFNAVHFLDKRQGWAVGNGGAVFSTVDGGKTWQQRAVPTSADLYDICFRDKETGFTVGENGVILRTLDSGRIWTRVNSGLKHRLERLAFSGEGVFAVGFGGAFLTARLTDEHSSASATLNR